MQREHLHICFFQNLLYQIYVHQNELFQDQIQHFLVVEMLLLESRISIYI
jgi:hypothetical protein